MIILYAYCTDTTLYVVIVGVSFPSRLKLLPQHHVLYMCKMYIVLLYGCQYTASWLFELRGPYLTLECHVLLLQLPHLALKIVQSLLHARV